MKAVRVHAYGGPEVLTYEEVEDPTPAPDEVVVDMKVIGVNFSDTQHRKGASRVGPLPLIPGHEGIGLVARLGSNVTTLKVGDRVAFTGQHRRGTYKEQMVIPATDVVSVPATIDTKLAVAVLNQGQTAYYLLHEAHPTKAGEKVLIHAAAGGVGSNLVQIAKRLGASVFATVSSEAKVEFVRGLGADAVCIYTERDFVQEGRDWTGGRGFDAVFDAVGGDVLLKSLRSLARKGHLVTYGQSSGPPPPIEWPNREAGSYFMSYHTGADYSQPSPETFARAQELFRWVVEGQLKVHVHKEYPLSEAARAHADIEGRQTIGRLLLIP